MRKLTNKDWEILKSFKGPIINREEIFNSLQLRMSYEEQEELYRFFLIEDWHHDHENIVRTFQRLFNKNPKNIEVILNRLNNLPEFYRHDRAISDPFIRSCVYAIAAQPEPESIETLTQLRESEDESIHEYAQHQLEKIARKSNINNSI